MTLSQSRFARLWREMRVTAALALPMVLGQLSSMAMNIVDTVLAGHHSKITLAAVGVGSALWSVVILLCIGVLMAVPPSVAQLNGAQRRSEIAPLFRQAMWLALAMGMALLLLMRLSPLALSAFGIAADVQAPAAAFLLAIGWGAPALAGYFCCRYLSEGIAWTRPTMLFGIGGLLLLVPLGVSLMFQFGLGAAGLGYAVASVLWLQFLAFLGYLYWSRHYADLGLFDRIDPPHWPLIRQLLALGLPMGVSVFMEGSLFVLTALIIGTLGAVPIAAHQIAIIVASACFMLPLGLAMATTIRIGHAVGAGDGSAVRWSAAAGYGIAGIAQTCSAVLLIFSGSWLAGCITADPAVIALATTLMLYAAVFQYPDGLQAMSAGALRGLKDTTLPMFITVLAYWGLGLPLGTWLGLHREQGATGLWTGLILGLSAAAALLTWRFWRLARRL